MMSILDQRCLRPIMAMLCVIALQGCSEAGGLGGSDGGRITPIAGSDFSYGTITGFGSVIINGERYSTDASRFLIDGVEGSQPDLALGMLMSAEVDFERMTASAVFYEPTVSGPVTLIDLQTSRLNILWQSISINADTILDNLVPADIRLGNFLQLTGKRSATGSIRGDHKPERSGTGLVSNRTALFTSNSALVLTSGGREIVMNSTSAAISIGRALDNDLVVDHGSTSRVHASIQHLKGQYILVDCSTNGTYVAKHGSQPFFIWRERTSLEQQGVIGAGWDPREDPSMGIFYRISVPARDTMR